MSNNWGGNDSSVNPLAFDSPVVRDRHSRFSRLTESFNISRLGGGNASMLSTSGLFNDSSSMAATVASTSLATPTQFNHHTSRLSGDFNGRISSAATFDGGIGGCGTSFSLGTTLQLQPSNAKENAENRTSAEERHSDDMARLAIFESFFQLAQNRANEPEETFALLQAFDQTCDANLLASKEMLERKVRAEGEASYRTKFCSLVRLERNSWRLLAALYQDRLQNANKNDSLRASYQEKSGEILEEEAMDVEEDIRLRLSDAELAERALKRHAALREMQIVIDWLESVYDEETLDKVQFYSDGPNYWENTLHALKMEKRKKLGGSPGNASFTGGSPGSSLALGLDKGRQYCQQMDPDASIRSGLPLHDLDKDDEARLFHYLFRLVRAGQLQEGKEIAERQGYFWLSAALEGWLLHHDPNYSPSSGNDEMEGGSHFGVASQIEAANFNSQASLFGDSASCTQASLAGAVHFLEPALGNPYRDLWKLAAWKAAHLEGTNLYERALFAVFSGNRGVLLPLCGQWADRLWAYYKCSLDVHLEDLLAESNIPKPDAQPRNCVQLPDAYWDYKLSAEEIFRELNASGSLDGVAPRQTSLNLEVEEYHQAVEQLIILGQVDTLVDRLYEWCKTIAGRREARARGVAGESLTQPTPNNINANFSLFGGSFAANSSLASITAAAASRAEEEELARTVEPNLLRFFAHLVLALQNFGLVRDEKQVQLCIEVLEVYIGFLIEFQLVELVAFYALRLPEHRQVAVYATLLEGIDDPSDRKLCLLVGRSSGLNLPAILATVVENIRTGCLGYQIALREKTEGSKKTKKTTEEGLTGGNRSSPSPFVGSSKLIRQPQQLTNTPSLLLTSTPTEEEQRKIGALDWLLLLPEANLGPQEPLAPQWMELLVQGNSLLRAFLLEQKIDQARVAFQKLPPGIVSSAFEQWKGAHGGGSGSSAFSSVIGSLDIDNVAREYLCHRAFFEAHEAFQKWHHYLYNSKPREPARPKSLARLGDRVAFEQATKAYEEELAVWKSAICGQAEVTASKLLAFLRFPEGVWVNLEDLKMMAEMAEQEVVSSGGVPLRPDRINEEGDIEEEGEVAFSPTEKMLLEAKRKDWLALRAGQLDALRRIYIPQFVALLLSVYGGSGEHAKALAVADIVADEWTGGRLHGAFTPAQMGELLGKLREAAIAVLDEGREDPLGYY